MDAEFVDAHGEYSRKRALYFAEAFEEFGVKWFKEPVSSDDLEGLRLLRDLAPAETYIAAGKYGYDLFYFRRMLEAGAVDVMRNKTEFLLFVILLTGISLAYGSASVWPGAVSAANVGGVPASLTRTQSAATSNQVKKQSENKLVLSTRLVNPTVTVTDSYGRFVTGLRKEHFEVYDDKVKQEIAHFSDEDAPVSLGIVYDVSGSMKERITRSLGALKRFIETSHDDDDVFLMAFNDRPMLVEDFTTSADRLIGRLMFVSPKKSTALYDAVYLAVEKVRQGRHSKKALLVISDGQDNNSRYSYKELRNRVKEADVLIYAIGITDPYNDSLAGFGRGLLEELARMTGGRAFFPNGYNEPELMEVCTRIALELRHQYAIGFYPTDTSNKAKWHKVKIKVKPPGGVGRLSLSYKTGYQSFAR